MAGAVAQMKANRTAEFMGRIRRELLYALQRCLDAIRETVPLEGEATQLIVRKVCTTKCGD